jgi:hypothetical protein
MVAAPERDRLKDRDSAIVESRGDRFALKGFDGPD